jgi:hypothetical protein
MTLTVFQIKFLHSIIFLLLSASVLFTVYSAVTGHITTWTWIAAGAVLIESVTLAFFGGRCPLTIWAENRGAERGSVTDLFLPKWWAERVFPICGTAYAIALGVLIYRVYRGPGL